MTKEPKQLTVGELIESLSRFPQSALVYTEGCDCTGDACGVTMTKDGEVYIRRWDGWGNFGRRNDELV